VTGGWVIKVGTNATKPLVAQKEDDKKKSNKKGKPPCAKPPDFSDGQCAEIRAMMYNSPVFHTYKVKSNPANV
jgi:hypothetical protein